MTWYYEKQGRQEGPVSASELEALIDHGVLDGKSLVWSDGMKEWQHLNLVTEFQHKLRPEEATDMSYENLSSEVDVYAASKQGEVLPSIYVLPPSKTLPVLSLVFACTSMLLFCIPCIPFVFTVASIVCGHIGYANAMKEPEKYAGKELAIAGLVLAYIILSSQALMLIVALI